MITCRRARITGSSGNPDLYVKYCAQATITSYDTASQGSSYDELMDPLAASMTDCTLHEMVFVDLQLRCDLTRNSPTASPTPRKPTTSNPIASPNYPLLADLQAQRHRLLPADIRHHPLLARLQLAHSHTPQTNNSHTDNSQTNGIACYSQTYEITDYCYSCTNIAPDIIQIHYLTCLERRKSGIEHDTAVLFVNA